MGPVGPGGCWECVYGLNRFVDSEGRTVADGLSEDDYASYLGKAVESWSYPNSPTTSPWATRRGSTV